MSLSRLLATAHKLSVNFLSALDDLFCSLVNSVSSADWTEHGSATIYVVFKQWCLSFGCARLSHCGSCCGPPTAFPCGHRCTVGVLAGTHRCALMPRVASRQSANTLWLLECGLVNVSWWSNQRDCTLLLLYVCGSVFDNNSWFTIIGMREHLHSCSTSSAVLRALRRSDCFGWLCVLCNQILRPTKLDQHALHLVRNIIALFLLAACQCRCLSCSPPMLICFTFKRLLLARTAAAPSAALEKLPHCQCLVVVQSRST